MYCYVDVRKSIVIYIIVHVLQLCGGSDESANISCRLSRTSLDSGFHRTVETVVNLTSSGSFLVDCHCVILLKELLPSGLYVDTYQTDSLHHHGAAQVYSPRHIDLELPEYVSQSHEIFVYRNMTHSNGDGLMQANISLPIHLRYHQPRLDTEFLLVSLQPPSVMLHCTMCPHWFSKLEELLVNAPCSNNTSLSCAWLQLQCDGGQELMFEVPVGQLCHLPLVTIVTVFVTFMSAVVLIAVLCRPSDSSAKKET